MKPIWSGSISFGLVSIPIKLYSAVEQHSLGFKLLCSACHKPINYKRECACDQNVAWKDVEKGIEYERGKYFILTKEHIEQLKPVKTQNIVITEFVDAVTISPIYYDKHYYALPAKADERAYFLFNKILGNSNKVAVGTLILREKEYPVAIQAHENNSLLLSTLNYAYEIRPVTDVPELKKVPTIQVKELKLAEQLIKMLYKKKFNIAHFKDTFAQNLKALLKKSAGKLPKTQTVKKAGVKSKANKPASTLMDILQASIIKRPSGATAKRVGRA